MAYVLFISEEYLKDSTAINLSVDPSYILPYVKVAQKKYVETKLGTDLFEKLQDLIKNGTLGNVGNEAYKTLVDKYIGDMLVHYAFYECLPFLRYKIQNNNIVSKTSENGSPLTREEAQDLRAEIEYTAQFYTERMIDYIVNNTTSFPEYSTNSGADVSPDKNAYYVGMNLERPRQEGTEITLRNFLTPDLT